MIGRPTRNGALPDSGTPSPNPWDLPLSRQNDWITLETLERRIGLRRDATRAPIPGPEWHGAALQSRPKHSTPRPRRTLTYCGQKMVLTMGSTIHNHQAGCERLVNLLEVLIICVHLAKRTGRLLSLVITGIRKSRVPPNCYWCKPSRKKVGSKVRALRKKRGWSQDVFADRFGLHRAHVGSIEREGHEGF